MGSNHIKHLFRIAERKACKRLENWMIWWYDKNKIRLKRHSRRDGESVQHLFLTGEIQVGKSTLIGRLLKACPTLRIGGFRTVWSAPRQAPRNTLHIVPAFGEAVPTEANCVGLRDHAAHRRVDFPQVYDKAGTALLRDAARWDLIVMDEIGRGEDEARQFQAAVLNLLGADTPILGVVQARAGVLPDRIRQHPKVRLLTVTEENRDDLAAELIAEQSILRQAERKVQL